MSNDMTSLGAKQGYEASLRSLIDGPRPRQDIDPSIARRLEREGYCVVVRRSSPHPGHLGRNIDHLALTETGYDVAASITEAGPPPPGLLQRDRHFPDFAGIGSRKPPSAGGSGTSGFITGVLIGTFISAGS